jgi:hypothetical protein
MALFTPSLSPAISVREIDLTGTVPNISSTTGAFVGDFRWGPIDEAILVGNETELVNSFGAPNQTGAVDFLSATSFLRYSSSLYVVRAADAAAYNAIDSAGAAAPSSATIIKNLDDFNSQKSTLEASTSINFIGKWAGDAANSLKVSICGAVDSSGASAHPLGWDTWAYSGNFDTPPGTSPFASDLGGSFDEVHVAVIDEDGTFSGTKGTVLETFEYVSLASDAKTTDGTTNFIRDVINNKSNYVWAVGEGAQFEANGSNTAALNTNFRDSAQVPFVNTSSRVVDFALGSGANSGALTPTEYSTGFDLFDDANTITVDFLIAPGMSGIVDQTNIVNYLTGIVAAADGRKDAVVVTSPHRSGIVNATPTNAVTAAKDLSKALTKSSYVIMDNNYLKVYDKYNDQYVFLPAAASTAGLMAGTDAAAGPWYSPAGQRRGLYYGVTGLAYNATRSQRDDLYKDGINPIVNLPGQGVMLYGDKTLEARPTAFNRINVRRLFLVLERAIKNAARNVLFEFNDEFTRAEFVNIVEPFLREIQGQRGITDFRVVCDETNNTAAVIDANRFVASIFVKPARSINYITLNFVAVRTGVEFEEVVGSV